MSGADFEYAIKKDVRNNPIVREIDEARQRQIRRSLAIGALLVAVMLFSAWQNAALVQHGYKLQRLQQQIEAEKVTNRRLRLEIEALRSPERIEDLAKRLKLVAPAQGEAIVIERVTPAAPPDKSVVAAR
jgi:cell division protein FtsL